MTTTTDTTTQTVRLAIKATPDQIWQALTDGSVTPAYYVGFRVGDQELGLDPHGHSQGMTGPVGYWDVDDINDRLDLLLAAGAEVQNAVRDVGGGKLIATVKDIDGNVIGVTQSP